MTWTWWSIRAFAAQFFLDFTMEETMPTQEKTVSLVLGSGGARGLTHIGIIQWLEENGYRIQSVSGCSMGALVGGIYAAGKLDEFQQWVRAISKLDIVMFLDISFTRGGFVKGEKIIQALKELVGEHLIEELPISFTAVATDLEREKEVWIHTGPLFDAIRASISLPFFFTPYKYHGITLIDGGVLNPVPIAPTFHDATDLTIAVNLGGPPIPIHEKPDKNVQETSESTPFQEKIQQFLSRLAPSKRPDEPEDNWGMQRIASQSFDAMQGTIARQKLAAYPPDIVIEIARNICGTLEFHRADEMIALGYEKAQKSLSNLNEKHILP